MATLNDTSTRWESRVHHGTVQLIDPWADTARPRPKRRVARAVSRDLPSWWYLIAITLGVLCIAGGVLLTSALLNQPAPAPRGWVSPVPAHGASAQH